MYPWKTSRRVFGSSSSSLFNFIIIKNWSAQGRKQTLNSWPRSAIDAMCIRDIPLSWWVGQIVAISGGSFQGNICEGPSVRLLPQQLWIYLLTHGFARRPESGVRIRPSALLCFISKTLKFKKMTIKNRRPSMDIPKKNSWCDVGRESTAHRGGRGGGVL